MLAIRYSMTDRKQNETHTEIVFLSFHFIIFVWLLLFCRARAFVALNGFIYGFFSLGFFVSSPFSNTMHFWLSISSFIPLILDILTLSCCFSCSCTVSVFTLSISALLPLSVSLSRSVSISFLSLFRFLCLFFALCLPPSLFSSHLLFSYRPKCFGRIWLKKHIKRQRPNWNCNNRAAINLTRQAACFNLNTRHTQTQQLTY